jgi:hypothetical protein
MFDSELAELDAAAAMSLTAAAHRLVLEQEWRAAAQRPPAKGTRRLEPGVPSSEVAHAR